MLTGFLFELLEQHLLQLAGIGRHFAGGDFLVCRALEAEFAYAETFLVSHWRAEHAAGHGARVIKIAEAGVGVEHWAGFVVGKILEG